MKMCRSLMISGNSRGIWIDYLYRMINDEINWTQRVDLLRITAQGLDGVTHGSKVDNSWNSGEVLISKKVVFFS